MSDQLFSADARSNTGKPTENVDHNDQTDQTDYLALLKEQGRSVDAAALAKSKVHADRKIQELITEQNELRAELEKRLQYEDLMDQIKQLKGQNVNSSPKPEANENVNDGIAKDKSFTPEEMQRLIRETLNQETAQRTATQNIQEAKKALESVWGRDYQSKLLERAAELGVSKEYLEQTAATSPKALLRLVGINPSSSQNTNQDNAFSPPHNRVNSDAYKGTDTGGKNYKYFENLRKTDPKTYYSASTQKEMHALAAKRGPDFYK